MTALGELLLQKNRVSKLQLEAARQRQKQLGGRLGTALLELDCVSEPLLLRALSEQLGVPSADLDDLRGLKPAVVGILPTRMALRAEAVPFRTGAAAVDVALLNPLDLALQDEIAFVVGKRVRIHVAHEVRIAEALHAYYGKDLSIRFRNLLDRLNRKSGDRPAAAADQPARKTAPAPAPAVATRTAPARPQPPRRPTVIELSSEERAALHSAAPVMRTSSLEINAGRLLRELDQRLSDAQKPDQVGAALLDPLKALFERTALFRVRRRRLGGWMGSGTGIDPQRLRSFETDLERTSVFHEMASSGRLFRGVLAPLPTHLELFAAWQGSPGIECMLAPVMIRGRLAAALYGDRGKEGVGGVDQGLVLQLAARAAQGLERCILQRKLRV